MKSKFFAWTLGPVWFGPVALPAPAQSAPALRPSFWSSATKLLPHSGPARGAVSPEMLLTHSPVWFLGLGLSSQHLLRLWCISYWEERPEASWATVRWWFLPCQNAETNQGQSSRCRLSSTFRVFLQCLSPHWPCPALYCPWNQTTQFRATGALAQSTATSGAVPWKNLYLLPFIWWLVAIYKLFCCCNN